MKLSLYLEVVQNPNFLKLWISQATSALTNYILGFAILIKVFQLTDSSLSVSLILLTFGLATVLFGAIGGVYADRFDRKWIITIANFAQAATISLYFVVGTEFLALFLIAFLYASINQFYMPSEAPSIPMLVKKEQILIANSFFAFTNSAALIVGFASAGPLAASFGSAAPFAIGTMLLVVAGLATLTLPSIKVLERKEREWINKVWYEFKEGIAHFWNNKELHFPLLALIAVQVINGMLITIAPAFMSDAIGINLETGSLMVVAPLGFGILLGALLLGLEERRWSKRTLVLVGFLGMGIMLFALSFIQNFPNRLLYYSLIGFLIGIFNAHIFAPSHSLMQISAHSLLRGRVYAALYILLQVAATFPTVIIGLLADKVPITYVMAILGLSLALFGVILKTLDNKTKFSKIEV